MGIIPYSEENVNLLELNGNQRISGRYKAHCFYSSSYFNCAECLKTF